MFIIPSLNVSNGILCILLANIAFQTYSASLWIERGFILTLTNSKNASDHTTL